MTKPAAAFLSFLLLLNLALAGPARAQQPAPAAARSAAPAAPVAPVAPAVDPSAIRVLLVPELETTLSAQMNGTLGEINASLGRQVPKGALLVQLQCGEQQARAKVAEAELAQARQNLDAKKALRELNAVGDLEVSMAVTETEKAAGSRTLAVTQAGYCAVRAPFGARVAKVYAKSFQTVSAGTPLFDIVSDSALKLRLNVPSTLLRQLQPGMPFKVSILETGKTYPARISAVNARVDAVAQTVELEGKLDERFPDLIAGMSGIASFPGAAQ